MIKQNSTLLAKIMSPSMSGTTIPTNPVGNPTWLHLKTSLFIKSIVLFVVSLIPNTNALAFTPTDAGYRTYASSSGSTIDSGYLTVPTISDIDYQGGTDPITGDVTTFVGSAVASGGQRPQAQIDAEGASAAGFISSSGTLSAEVSYSYVVRATGSSTRTAVPLRITVLAEASVQITDPRGGSGIARADVQVRLPGEGHNFFRDGVVATPSQTSGFFSKTLSAVVGTGGRGSIRLYAYGEVFSFASIHAVADPIILIDPTATFIENGQEYFYTDAFTIDYSPTVEQYVVPLPLSGFLFMSGLLSLTGIGARNRDLVSKKCTARSAISLE